MHRLYKEIAEQLKPYKDKVFFKPLKKHELELLENRIGQQFPDYYRHFLLSFGMQQDFIDELIKHEADLIASYCYLPDCYKKSFLPIADNGGEETWLLKITDNNDQQVYEWQNWMEGEIVPLGFTFHELIEKNLQALKLNYCNKFLNTSKQWCVQFVVAAPHEDALLSSINAVKAREWTETSTCQNSVRYYETEMELVGRTVKLTRHEHDAWTSPIYYFDVKEAPNKIGKCSVIKKIDTQLKEKFSNYKLIDHGIVPVTEVM